MKKKKYFTVADLEKFISDNKLPKNTVFVVQSSNTMEQGNSTVGSTSAYIVRGEFKEESFRDAFDGGSYRKDVLVQDFNEKSKAKRFIKFH